MKKGSGEPPWHLENKSLHYLQLRHDLDAFQLFTATLLILFSCPLFVTLLRCFRFSYVATLHHHVTNLSHV